jgi:hypothetical protein
MNAKSEIKEIALRELEALLELRRIIYFELSARRWGSTPGLEESPPESPSTSMRVMNKIEQNRLIVRTRVDARGTQARIVVDLGAIFELEEGVLFQSQSHGEHVSGSESGVSLEEETLKEFSEKVGVPTLYPFIRESLFTCATRIGVKPPLLGLLRRDGVKLKEE